MLPNVCCLVSLPERSRPLAPLHHVVYLNLKPLQRICQARINSLCAEHGHRRASFSLGELACRRSIKLHAKWGRINVTCSLLYSPGQVLPPALSCQRWPRGVNAAALCPCLGAVPVSSVGVHVTNIIIESRLCSVVVRGTES